MDLSYWADVAEVAGTLTIVAGLVFGLIQVREYRRQRNDAVASELMRSFYDSELSEAVALLQPLADGLSAAEVREEQAHPAFAEWFEWLAMMAERHKAKEEPAYLRGADWKP